ncbi:MAG: PilZ domain-containing protein [Acidobacteria bacterium]|nr:PilZ domain-containing protein [Acidobacteriota bacterium]MBI3487649.1 PilZ domain-containing protein [Acidobacteriota bacterium]
MSPATEHRRHRRVPIAYQVKLVADDRIIAYPQAVNLSLGGILLKGRDRLPVGTQCGVAILMSPGEPGGHVVARGTVVRNDERGMAIAFSRALDASSEAALRQLIETLGGEAAGGPCPLWETGSE